LGGGRPVRRKRDAACDERRGAQQVAAIDTVFARVCLITELRHRDPSTGFPLPS
jgi:hypothetical protein